MSDLLDDVRIGLRNLRKRPAVTATAVLILALGIGAVTTVWGLADLVLMRPAHAADPGRLVNVHAKAKDGSGFHAFSYPDYLELRDEPTLAGLAAWNSVPTSLGVDGGARLALGQIVSANYFEVFGVRPVLGRFFDAGHAAPPGAHPVAVVSHALWQREMGGSPDAIGRAIQVNGHPFTVIGVAPPGFGGPIGVVDTELFLPLAMQAQVAPTGNLDDPGFVWLEAVGRLAPGVEPAQAMAALERRGRAVLEARGRTFHGVAQTPVGVLPGVMRGPLGMFVGVLAAAVALLLAITSANVGGMLLGRAVERRGEMAVRAALGAGRARLARLLLVETLALFAAGTALGVTLASFALRLVPTIDWHLPITLRLDLGLDGRAVVVSVSAALLTALVFGLLPALRAARPDLARSLARASGRGTGRSRQRSVFVIAQVAGSCVLLVAAGLLVKALSTAGRIDPGFDARGVWVAAFDLSLAGHDETTGPAIRRAILEQLAADPAVDRAGVAQIVPLTLANSTTAIHVDGFEPPEDDGFPVDANTVDGDYFEALGIPLLAGRPFGPADRAGGPNVAIVNRTLAERFWGTAAAVGKRIHEGTETIEVVGVVGDVYFRSLGEAPRPMLFRTAGQSHRAVMSLHVAARAGAPADEVAAAIRGAVARVDPDVPILDLRTLEAATALAVLPQRLASSLTGTLGLLGALLAALGIYGLVSFTVAQRTREMGLRMALGADGSSILRLVLRQGLALAGAGIGIGLLGAAAMARLLRSLLLGARADDLAVFGAAVAMLLAVAAFASLLPAMRAARLPPSVALRHDG